MGASAAVPKIVAHSFRSQTEIKSRNMKCIHVHLKLPYGVKVLNLGSQVMGFRSSRVTLLVFQEGHVEVGSFEDLNPYDN